MVSTRHATMAEVNTILGAEDLYDLLEIVAVDVANDRKIRRLAPTRA